MSSGEESPISPQRLALLPSAEQLRQATATPHARAAAGEPAPDLPAELSNPAASLPRPVSLDEARQLARARHTPPQST